MRTIAKHMGYTLLEVMLVLAIAATIIVSAIGLYQRQFRLQANLTEVQGNVDKLFQATADYHQANCAGSLTGMTSTNVPIPIDTKLFPTYLARWPFLPNSLVDNTGGSNGYIVQLNKILIDRTICMDGTGPSPLVCNTTKKIGTIVLWKIQVAVLIRDTANASKYVGLLGATCLSSLNGLIVNPCSSSSTGNWVVWERLPSFATTQSNNDLWQSAQTVKQFKQMYTTYPMTYLTGGYLTNPEQYFLCGG